MVFHPLNHLAWNLEPIMTHLSLVSSPYSSFSVYPEVFLFQFFGMTFILLSLDFRPSQELVCLFGMLSPTCQANSYLFFKAQQKPLPQKAFHKPCCHVETLPLCSQSTPVLSASITFAVLYLNTDSSVCCPHTAVCDSDS